MNQLVAQAIKGALAGTLLVACMYATTALMIGLEEQAYYSGPPKGYDNDFLGMGWVILFILSLPAVLMITGAVTARKIAVRGVKDVIKASALAGVLAVLMCGVKKQKNGVVASCVAGMVACTISFVGEAIRAVMNELFIPGMYTYQPIEEATLNSVASGAFEILQCAPFKLIFMTGVAMTGGIMVTAWVLNKTK